MEEIKKKELQKEKEKEKEQQQQKKQKKEGFFIKLSFMSPKDVALRPTNNKTKTLIVANTASLFSSSSLLSRLFTLSSSHPLAKQLFLDSLYSSLRVVSGEEAIKMVCDSRRFVFIYTKKYKNREI